MEQVIERPLPKPTSADYASARLLEALVEAKLALDFLKRGLTRNAAGKAFQAWKAVLAALLKLELERLKAMAKSEEERRWLEERAVARVPTTKMLSLSQLLRGLGYEDVVGATFVALSLHDYQYHGPDPDIALSKFRSREEAAVEIAAFLCTVVKYVEKLKEACAECDRLIGELKEELKGV